MNRRDFLCGLAGTAAALVGFGPASAEQGPRAPGPSQFGEARALKKSPDFRWLIGALQGFSAELVSGHLALLDRYREKLREIEGEDRRIDLALADPLESRWRSHVLAWTELHNAVTFHELYFEGLTPGVTQPGEAVASALKDLFGSFDQWWVQFRATALASRAWAVLAIDTGGGGLRNLGLDTDSSWPVGYKPVLVLDTAEHAYCLDFPGRAVAYVDAWLARVDWQVAEDRLLRLQKGMRPRTGQGGDSGDNEF